jgi:hypothetical protein
MSSALRPAALAAIRMRSRTLPRLILMSLADSDMLFKSFGTYA